MEAVSYREQKYKANKLHFRTFRLTPRNKNGQIFDTLECPAVLVGTVPGHLCSVRCPQPVIVAGFLNPSTKIMSSLRKNCKLGQRKKLR